MNYQTIALCLICLTCTACKNTQQESVPIAESKKAVLDYDTHYFELRQAPEADDIFKLSSSQTKQFLNYYYDPKNAEEAGHYRLANFMEELIAGFDFRGNTYTASEAMENFSGNCLSLAILTTALANLVDIDVSYQLVNSAPVYTRYHNVMTLSSHVRTELHSPDFVKEEGFFYIFTPKLIIDYFPQRGNVVGKTVSKEDFISMYYQNMAGDALVKEQLNLTYSFIVKALQQSPHNSSTLNTLAVLFKYAGNFEQAEHIYKEALDLDADSLNLISNYIILLEEQERLAEAEVLNESIDKIDDENPYRWYDIANKHFENGDFHRALKYYQRALDVAPYLHEGYFYLAKTYHQLGRTQQSEIAIKKALEMSYLPKDRHLYQAKMLILKDDEQR